MKPYFTLIIILITFIMDTEIPIYGAPQPHLYDEAVDKDLKEADENI
jgi:hypothetical protein